jgi:carboxyl-terminal processing protease
VDPEKKNNRMKNFIGLGMLLVCVFTLGLVVGRNFDERNIVLDFTKSKELDFSMFWQVLDISRRDYVDSSKIEDEDIVYGAIKGMVSSFGDPATIFLTPEETEEFNSATQGKYFEGIGAELGYDEGQIIVVTPLEGSPAKEAGIRPGDYILKIDDYELTVGDTVYDAVTKIRGEAGTEVVVKVLHKGDIAPVDIKIVRKEITVPSMTLEFVGEEKDIAFFKVSRFTEASYSEWARNWDLKVDEILSSKVNKMILDLRGNPGGYFDAAIYAADEFLDEGIVISKQRDANGRIKEYNSKKSGRLQDIEVVVLVNSGSASASEILSGALQFAKRAEVIGEKTFGKGTAQKVYDLSDGSSLHLTILRWLLPDGKQIEKENSVNPDIEVQLTNDDFIKGIDPQLNKALEIFSK